MSAHGIIDRSKFSKIADTVFRLSKPNRTEIVLGQGVSSLTRLANNAIHQNVAENNTGISIRVMIGKRQGRSTTTRMDKEGLERAVRTAQETARHQREEPGLMGLPAPQEYASPRAFDRATGSIDPHEKAQLLKQATDLVKKNKLQAAGMFTTGIHVQAVANSRGLRAYHASTSARFSLTAMAPDSAGWSEGMSWRKRDIEVERVTQTAIDKALAGKDPIDLPAGKYDVILEPAAMTDFLLYMGWHGFGGLAFLEGRSFVSGKLGEQVLGSNITIVDDVNHPLTVGLPFDFEGMPRRRVVLVERGVAKGVVHDRKTAKLAGARCTGHGLPQPNPFGPIPMNLVVSPGESSIDAMIAGTTRGVLVTQFHYTNIIEPQALVLTGMTRNGTFLIEDGQIKRAVKNLRFTQSACRAFSNVAALTREQYYCGSFFGGSYVVPGALIKGFSFSSTTSF